jgi:hypothetical protein
LKWNANLSTFFTSAIPESKKSQIISKKKAPGIQYTENQPVITRQHE